LTDRIIFKKCNIVPSNGYYVKEPKFKELYLLNGEVSINEEVNQYYWVSNENLEHWYSKQI